MVLIGCFDGVGLKGVGYVVWGLVVDLVFACGASSCEFWFWWILSEKTIVRGTGSVFLRIVVYFRRWCYV